MSIAVDAIVDTAVSKVLLPTCACRLPMRCRCAWAWTFGSVSFDLGNVVDGFVSFDANSPYLCLENTHG